MAERRKPEDQKAESGKPAAKPSRPPKSAKAEPKKAAAEPKKTAAEPKKTAAEPKKTAAEPKKTASEPKKTAAEPAAKRQSKPRRTAKQSPKPAAADPSEPAAPVVRARARYLRVPPRKARMVADQIRGLGIADARALLDFSTRGAARDLRKLLDSAAANAEANHDLIADDLRIADIHVDEGPTLRRYQPRALGRATRIDKRTSHVSLSLTPED